jgi:hypothetical protein
LDTKTRIIWLRIIIILITIIIYLTAIAIAITDYKAAFRKTAFFGTIIITLVIIIGNRGVLNDLEIFYF